MRRLLPVVALVVAGGLLLAPSFAGAQTGGQETLVLISTTLRAEQIDLGASGESPGDLAVFKEALWNEAQTARVGTDWVECTADFGTAAVCTVGSRITGRGMLTGTGVVDFQAQSFVFPITGGTGDFQNVTGEVHVTFQDQEASRLVFHLSGTRP
jgi:hypothetical protein